MRQKDALANENTVLNKLAEKQQQKVEAANEIQRSLQGQLVRFEFLLPPLSFLPTSPSSTFSFLHRTSLAAHPLSSSPTFFLPHNGTASLTLLASQTAAEKEISLHQKNVRAYQDNIAQYKRDNAELTLRAESNQKQLAEVRFSLCLFLSSRSDPLRLFLPLSSSTCLRTPPCTAQRRPL